jgi:hypothetical protein
MEEAVLCAEREGLQLLMGILGMVVAYLLGRGHGQDKVETENWTEHWFNYPKCPLREKIEMMKLMALSAKGLDQKNQEPKFDA